MPSLSRPVAVAALLAAVSSAFAHPRLQASEPAGGATVPAPAAARLRFDEAVEPAASSVKVFGPGDAAVDAGKPTGADGDARTLVSTLPKLAPGAYRLEWSTVGHDGHRTRGELRFTVK